MATKSSHAYSKLLTPSWNKDSKLANISDTLLGVYTEHSSKT